MARGAAARRKRSSRRSALRAARGVNEAPTQAQLAAAVGITAADLAEIAGLGTAQTEELEDGDACSCGHLEMAHMDGTGECSAEGCTCEAFEAVEEEAASEAAADVLSALDVFLHSVTCECGHPFSEHLGADGPCTHEDGRGNCGCGSYAEAGLRDAHAGMTAANQRRRALHSMLAAAAPNVEVTYELTLAQHEWAGNPIFAGAALGLQERSQFQWPSDAVVEPSGEVLYQDDHGYVARLDGEVVSVRSGEGWISVEAASASYGDAQDAVASFVNRYPPLYREATTDETVVPITFWAYGMFGPTRRMRLITAKPWAEVAANYPSGLRGELAEMMTSFEPGRDGQLILWQGPPGTGKTWSLRALASEWASWAEFHYITDPDAFFVSNPDYMIDVLLADSYESIDAPTGAVVEGERPEGKWRVLILEDTGELLAANAKEKQGQGLSRLLNVVDGMVGQGLRVLVLLTTNDELGDLHPAAQRPGRCAQRLTFGEFDPAEAKEWFAGRGAEDVEVYDPATIAELYAMLSELREAPEGEAAFEGEPVTAAAGDVAWAPEDGFCDLIDDINEALAPDEATMYAEDGYTSRGYAVDVAVTLDRALICKGGETYWVAPFTVGADGEPIVSPEDEWVPVESGWIEVPPEEPEGTAASARARLEFTHVNGVSLYHRHGNGDNVTVNPLRAFVPVGVDAPVPLLPQPVPTNASAKRWEAIFCPEAVLTEDKRAFRPGSIKWRDVPLSLMAMVETQEGHDGAILAGRIDRIWRDGSLIRAAGEFDTGEFGQEIARLVGDETLRGLSVDLAILDYTVGPRSDYFDEAGNWIAGEAAAETDEGQNLVEILLGDEDPIYVVNDAVIGMATVCPFPAFSQAEIALVSALRWRYSFPGRFVTTLGAPIEATPGDVITASAAGLAPVNPPAAWFNDPALDSVTALTVTPGGQVYGHLAPWGVCHIGLPGCRTAPSSDSGYRYFHLGAVECAEGVSVSAGKITLGTGHADLKLGLRAATEHYDHSGHVVADVRAGEDEHGIWVAGALRPDADAEKVRELRAAVLSGDWRTIDGGLEMVAALAVNVPGFPVPRQPLARIAGTNGEPVVASLVAAGVHYATPTAEEVAQIRDLAGRAEAETLGEIARLAGGLS